MPDMDGIELIRKIKEKDKNMKVIVMTGHILKEKAEEARKVGAQQVLIEPFKNETLYEVISKLLIK